MARTVPIARSRSSPSDWRSDTTMIAATRTSAMASCQTDRSIMVAVELTSARPRYVFARQKRLKACVQDGVGALERMERLDAPLPQIEQAAAESTDKIRLVRHRDDTQGTRRAQS